VDARHWPKKKNNKKTFLLEGTMTKKKEYPDDDG